MNKNVVVVVVVSMLANKHSALHDTKTHVQVDVVKYYWCDFLTIEMEWKLFRVGVLKTGRWHHIKCR